MSDDQQKKFRDYVERMKEIRLLSSPIIDEIENADDYSRILIRSFSRIGELAAENRKLIDDYIKPLLASRGKLPEETRKQLSEFNDLLVEDTTFAEIDAHLSEILNNLLLLEDEGPSDSADEDSLVILMARKVIRDYFMLSGLTRYINDEAENARKKAIENRDNLSEYLEKEKFSRLGDEAKTAVLKSSLLGALLYENNLKRMPESYWEPCVAIIDQGYEILNDDFYREAFPDYDWEVYEFRIYYYGSFLAYSMLPGKIAKKSYEYAQKAIDFLKRTHREDILANVNEEQEKDLLLLASVQAGITSAREACETFYEAYEKRDPTDFSLTSINQNMDTPSSYLCVAKMMDLELNEKDYDRYAQIQNSVLDYLYHVPNQSDSYCKCVTLFGNLPRYFREVPGAMTMEEFFLSALAAIHPPTYTHVNMVARISECMMRHLIATRPELLIDFPGCNNVDDVRDSAWRIINYTYHAALCHDLGKLFIIDTISMYGRNLLDDEFSIIRDHPAIGAEIAAEHASTRDYVDVILGHHVWYDCSKGYPSDFDTSKSPYKTVIDVVLAADCLDAATDTVGRSYSRGKVFEDYEREIREGAGTHYAPFLPELFRTPSLRTDIEYLLDSGRQNMYRETFWLIKKNEER